jgi:hypothetical protein
MIAAIGFCGVAIIGLAFWNYQLSGKNDEVLEQNRRMAIEIVRLNERNDQLLDDAAKLAAQVPLHDSKGRFKKK